MNRSSLRGRLLIAGGVTIGLTLLVAALGLNLIFARHAERVALADLDSRLLNIVSIVEPDGPSLRPIATDPRYGQPFSGHYWQIELGGEVSRSRSLWDYTLPAAEGVTQQGQKRVLALRGPQGEELLALDLTLTAGTGQKALPLRVVVATDRAALDSAARGFRGDVLPFLGVLGALLLTASWWQVRLGLRPLGQVARRVADLRTGAITRMGGGLPSEVSVLTDEIDLLLDARDADLARARHRAADLAHGLKSPLQALLGDADRLREQGEDEIAASIETISQAMRRHVDRELGRARIQSDRRTASADPARILEQVVSVLRRMPAGAALEWRIEAAPGGRIRIDPDDLTEALGALMENAMRYAVSRVTARISRGPDCITIAISDDGPGVAPADLDRLAQRGVRLDQAGEGQGIGLALVADIAEAAQGALHLSNLHPGFEARLVLQPVPAG